MMDISPDQCNLPGNCLAVVDGGCFGALAASQHLVTGFPKQHGRAVPGKQPAHSINLSKVRQTAGVFHSCSLNSCLI